ncbi:hypothetical protein [Roseivirga sp. E12]|uniref:hypothetical protein n=1 Tax=Roseivirga sp. E12 TaxID=2819237 RepID=UPI001ABCAED1|nr:hypothetical protein [Roseivirga sp. E12]MBO3698443.1 hypothetical protein [Roseivirga sp. E12]
MTQLKLLLTTFLLFANTIFAQCQENNCDRHTKFGDVNLCLAKIEGYQEAYSIPLVKELADGTEVPANTVLGFYLNDETYQRANELGQFEFDDYFKIYGTKQLMNYKANKESLKEMYAVLSDNFFTKNWDTMEKEVDKISQGIEIGVPIVIKSYYTSENSFTYVMITKYQPEGQEPYSLAMTMNGMVIQERLIWMAYYLNYEGEETIATLQSNSDRIVSTILKNN